MTVQSSEEAVERDSAAQAGGGLVPRFGIAVDIAERLLFVAVGAVGGLVVGGVIAVCAGWIEFTC
jgi:hypothetical protein